MAWYDGTDKLKMDVLKKTYPVYISDDLRMSEDKKSIVIINSFEVDSDLYSLADPKAENHDPDYVFYHDGDYTIKEYREEYLKLKEDDPNYKWITTINLGKED